MKLDYKISTITMSVNILKTEISLNLLSIGKYLEIDNNIVGIKYNIGDKSILKGIYETSVYKKSKNKNINKINKKLFYNQISIIYNNNQKHINIKLFANGSLHFTGIKNTDDALKITKIIYAKINLLLNITETLLLTKDNNGIYLDNHNLIYSNKNEEKDFKLIGYKQNNYYYIKNKEYNVENLGKNEAPYYILTTFLAKKTKTILDLNGNEIGYSKIELFKNKSKLYKKNSNINIINNLIYYDNHIKSNILGKIVINITENNSLITIDHNALIIEYKCNIINGELENNKNTPKDFLNLIQFESNINCINIVFNISFELNRQRLFNKLISIGYICEYKPEKYSGMKFIYKNSKNQDNQHNENNKDNKNNENIGKCMCNNSCTCENISFLIFQSGNIIVSGFKSEIDIDIILSKFKYIISNIEDTIKKRTLI